MLTFTRALQSLQIRSLFLRFIVYIVIVLVAVTSLIMFFFNLWYERSQSESEIDRIGLERSETTRQFTDALLRNIDAMTIRLANQSAISTGLAQRDASLLYEAAVEFSGSLQQSFPSSYAVRGLFIYSLQGGTIQVPLIPSFTGSQSGYKLDTAELQEMLKDGSKEDRWNVKRRSTGSRDNGARTDGSLLELIRPLPLLGNSVDGAIVVVLDPESLFQSPFVHHGNEKLWIQLPGGQYAYDTLYGTLVAQDEMNEANRRFRNGSLSYWAELQGTQYSFRIIDSSVPGWRYFYASPMAGSLNTSLILFGLLLLALAAGASMKAILISRQIHSSMAVLRNILAKRRITKQTAGDELTELIGEVSGLLERTEQLTNMLLQSETQKKINFIREMLNEASVYAEERLLQLRELGISVTAYGYFVVVFRIDDYLQFAGKYSKADQKLLRYFIAKMAEEQLAAHYLSIHADVKEREVIIIANLVENLPVASARSLTLQEVNSVCQHIHSYLRLTVSVGIGDLHTDIGCVSEAYQQALQALELRMYKGNKALIPIWHVKKNHHQMLIQLYNERKDIEQEWISASKNGNRALKTSCLKKMEKAIKSLDGCPLSLIHHTLWELVLLLLYHAEASNRERQVELEQLQNDLHRLETLEETMLWMEAVADQWMTHRQGAAETVSWSTADHILDYIQANHDKEISLNGIADQLGLDASYLSRLFKQEVGMNFIDYLVSMRIRRAKMLLLSTDHSIQTIGSMVGYQNVASFSRAFKKEENMSPGQFRALHDPKQLDVNEVY